MGDLEFRASRSNVWNVVEGMYICYEIQPSTYENQPVETSNSNSNLTFIALNLQ